MLPYFPSYLWEKLAGEWPASGNYSHISSVHHHLLTIQVPSSSGPVTHWSNCQGAIFLVLAGGSLVQSTYAYWRHLPTLVLALLLVLWSSWKLPGHGTRSSGALKQGFSSSKLALSPLWYFRAVSQLSQIQYRIWVLWAFYKRSV